MPLPNNRRYFLPPFSFDPLEWSHLTMPTPDPPPPTPMPPSDLLAMQAALEQQIFADNDWTRPRRSNRARFLSLSLDPSAPIEQIELYPSPTEPDLTPPLGCLDGCSCDFCSSYRDRLREHQRRRLRITASADALTLAIQQMREHQAFRRAEQPALAAEDSSVFFTPTPNVRTETRTMPTPTVASPPPKVTASALTFGCELETLCDRDRLENNGLAIADYHSHETTASIPRYLPSTSFDDGRWRAESDASIHSESRNMPGVEFISPVLLGSPGLTHLLSTASYLRRTFLADVNDSCGFHIHIGIPETASLSVINRLTALVANHELGLLAATGSPKRATSTYCHPIKDRFKDVRFADSPLASQVGPERNFARQKYHTLNLSPLFTDNRTVEFRIFSATLSPLKIAAFTQLALGLVELAFSTKRCVPWPAVSPNPPPTDLPPDQPPAPSGLTELNRLLARLRWLKPSGPRFGLLPHNPLPNPQFPSPADMAAELRSLASQYDTRLRIDEPRFAAIRKAASLSTLGCDVMIPGESTPVGILHRHRPTNTTYVSLTDGGTIRI